MRKPPHFPLLALAWPRNALLDDAATQVGVNQPPFGAGNRLAQRRIVEVHLAGESHEWLVLEYPHRPSRQIARHSKYTTWCYRLQGALKARLAQTTSWVCGPPFKFSRLPRRATRSINDEPL